jgi:hypothetical protein
VLRPHQPATLLRIQIDRAAGVEQAHERFAGVARAATCDDERALGAPDRLSRRLHGFGLRRQAARRLGPQPILQHQLGRHMGAQHVSRNFDIGRPRLAGVAEGARHRLIQLAYDLIGDAGGARIAADRLQQIDMRDVLQRPHIGLRARGAAADQQHRRAGERGVGHRGHTVGDAGPGGGHRHAEAAGQFGMGVRHMHRRALVAHVDDADAELRDMVPDWLDMTALQAEHAIDAAPLEETRDPRRAGEIVAVEILTLFGHFVPSSGFV